LNDIKLALEEMGFLDFAEKIEEINVKNHL
jgi:hypothetical protein